MPRRSYHGYDGHAVYVECILVTKSHAVIDLLFGVSLKLRGLGLRWYKTTKTSIPALTANEQATSLHEAVYMTDEAGDFHERIALMYGRTLSQVDN